MTASPTTRIFGSGIRRREDPRLITGNARYTDDIKLPGTLHMAIVRSPVAHAHIRGNRYQRSGGRAGCRRRIHRRELHGRRRSLRLAHPGFKPTNARAPRARCRQSALRG